MFKFVKLPAVLKTMLIAANTGFAGGDMLPVIVVSSLFSVFHRDAEPKGRAMPRCAPMDYPHPSSPNADQSFDFEGLNEAAMAGVSRSADHPRITSQNAKVFEGKTRLFFRAKRTNRKGQT